jgi:L-fuconolactonase
MDRAGVDEATLISTPLYGRGPRANEYVMRAIEAHPDRFSGVAILDAAALEQDDLRRRVERVLGHDRMHGVRIHRFEPPAEASVAGDNWLTSERVSVVAETVAEVGGYVCLNPGAEELGRVVEAVEAHPQVPFVLDHMALDDWVPPNHDDWGTLKRIAEAGTVAVKLSSLPLISATGWPYEDCHAHVHQLLEWFGADRLLLGSNYPWTHAAATYEESLSWLDAVESISHRDRASIAYRTAETFGICP